MEKIEKILIIDAIISHTQNMGVITGQMAAGTLKTNIKEELDLAIKDFTHQLDKIYKNNAI